MRGERPKIARVSVYSDDQLKATVAINDAGAYVPVVEQAPLGSAQSQRPGDGEFGTA